MKLDEVINKETGETRMDNLRNAVSLLSLVRNPQDITIPCHELKELLDTITKQAETIEAQAREIEILREDLKKANQRAVLSINCKNGGGV